MKLFKRLSMSVNSVQAQTRFTDVGLLYLRVTGSLLLLLVNGLPKVLHYTAQVAVIEDPLHICLSPTIWLAIFAEVICPLLMIVGIGVRVAAIPIMVVTVIALTLVHPDWTLEQAQFAWMLLIIFGTVAIGGAGRFRISLPRRD